jgi:hypothetical protein
MVKKFVKLFEGSINFELTKQKLYQTVSGRELSRRLNGNASGSRFDVSDMQNRRRKIVKNACLAIGEALSRRDSTHGECESGSASRRRASRRQWRSGCSQSWAVHVDARDAFRKKQALTPIPDR